jgi:phosphatidylglycerol:prolipoprotein diacylglycerol transferase
MLIYPDIDPVAFAVGPFKVHWYGLMYLVGFAAAWLLGRWRASRPGSSWNAERVDDVIFYCVIGVIAGGRLGYMLFYGYDQILANPLSLLKVWEGGMSFHGGLIGVLIAMWLFARKRGLRFFEVGDFVAPLVPLGLLAGRIGNFINGELWGHATRLPWGMRLPCERFPEYCAGLPLDAQWSPPLHASQLYEASLEGLVLFVVLWWFSSRPRPMMAVSGMFLLLYGLFRFSVEFVRQPDAHIGYIAFDWLTMGQLLTLPMIAGGLLLLGLAYARVVPGAEREGSA